MVGVRLTIMKGPSRGQRTMTVNNWSWSVPPVTKRSAGKSETVNWYLPAARF